MQPSTKKNFIIAACYAGTVVLGMLIGPKFSRENAHSRSGNIIPFFPARVEKVDRVLNIIEENYVDPVKADSMEDLAINQILNKLDPHSAYLPPVEAKRFSEDLDGNYNGIGIEYQRINDTVFVSSVPKNGPAAKAGVKPGDKIISVNEQNITGPEITVKRIVGLIKGRKGTDVRLLINRSGTLKRITVKRDKVVLSSIDAAYLVANKSGYVKISKFGARTDDDFALAIAQMKKQGMLNLILDLRGNGGGYLNAATALADQFLPEDKLIVFTQGEHEPRTDYFSTEKGMFETGKLVVLIDENSASASEILAGAIQDLDRGVIIGRRSFGKGLVQEQFNFGDGSALNLTVARYFTPSGRSIQKPYKSGSDKYFKEVADRYKNGEVADGKPADSINTKYKTFKTTSGRVIYGGGGITPDIFVPIDTSAFNDFYYKLNAKGVISEFSYKHLVKESRPTSISQFIKEFNITDTQFKKLLALASAQGVKFTSEEAQTAKPALNVQMKALVARSYYGDDGYYHVKNAEDKAIARALEVLKTP